jgi:hypothetical protein
MEEQDLKAFLMTFKQAGDQNQEQATTLLLEIKKQLESRGYTAKVDYEEALEKYCVLKVLNLLEQESYKADVYIFWGYTAPMYEY